MQTCWQDIRYALRQLRRSPGFVAVALLTLALGIGATTSIFTLVYQVMLRSMPVAHPEQLYHVGKDSCGGCTSGGLQDDWNVFSTEFYHQAQRSQVPGIAGMAASEAGAITASVRKAGDSSGAQPLELRFVSGNYFSVLGIAPYQGRLLRADDEREGAAPVAVISYTLWRTKFASDPALVGSTLLLTGHPVTVVGIAAADYLGERNQPDPPGIWLPLPFELILDPERSLNKFPGSAWLNLIVRIPDAHRVAPAGQALAAELRRWIAADASVFPESFTEKDLARQTTTLAPAADGINDMRDQYAKSLKLLLLVAGFVLLIACANLANLMLVRGMARQQELAVRTALGAPRGRLVRQMLVEAVILALGGGLGAIGVAYAGTQAILALAMRGVEVKPVAAEPSLPVLGFAFAVSLITGLIFGTAPAWIMSRSNPVTALRGANRSTGDASALPQKVLVVLQAALSLALLSTAGLLISSLRQLEHQNFRFLPEGRMIAFVDLGSAGYSFDRLPGLYQRLDDTFAHLPGIESFTYATYGPMTATNWATDVFFPGRPLDQHLNCWYTGVSAGYFETVGTRVLLGRGIEQQDTAASMHVAVVNEAFAAKYLAGRQPIGEHFGPDPRMPEAFEIVGVVEDTKYGNPATPAKPMYFTAMPQVLAYPDERDMANERLTHFAHHLIVQYRGDPAVMAASVRQAIKGVDPNIPIFNLRTYADQLSQNFIQQELVVRLTTLFGLLALLLASVGLYGVTAYTVARRTGEIGIRMALGASRGGVLRMIVERALSQAGIGLALGVPLSLVAGRLVEHSLYQISAFQPVVLVVVIALLLLAALAAAVIPARRAAKIDPMHALRSE
jgi:predicted permease